MLTCGRLECNLFWFFLDASFSHGATYHSLLLITIFKSWQRVLVGASAHPHPILACKAQFYAWEATTGIIQGHLQHHSLVNLHC